MREEGGGEIGERKWEEWDGAEDTDTIGIRYFSLLF